MEVSKKEKSIVIDINAYPFVVRLEDYGDDVIEYVVSFADFPGIIGTGISVDEAIKEARGLLKDTFDVFAEEGITIPLPKKVEAYPKLSGRLTFRTSQNVHFLINQYAEKEGISINAFINDAIQYYFRELDSVGNKNRIKETYEQCLDSFKQKFTYSVDAMNNYMIKEYNQGYKKSNDSMGLKCLN